MVYIGYKRKKIKFIGICMSFMLVRIQMGSFPFDNVNDLYNDKNVI